MIYLHSKSSYDARIIKTVGEGEPGPKTHSLRRDFEAAKRAGFHLPDHVAITPQIFVDFPIRSGALEARTEPEADKRIMACEFSPYERAAIWQALDYFPDHLKYRLLVRSDDYPAGVGLWYTGPASVYPYRPLDLDLLRQRVEHQVKMVLSSDFEADVVAFKQRKGIKENPGVLLMPIYGAEVIDQETKTSSERCIAPLVSMNYLGKVNGVASVSLGCGFGGANRYVASFYDSQVSEHSLVSAALNGGYFIDLKEGRVVNQPTVQSCIHDLSSPGVFTRLLAKVNETLGAFIAEVGSRYLEAIADFAGHAQWVLVQSAECSVPKVTRPAIEDGSKAATTGFVLGTGVTPFQGMHFVEIGFTHDTFNQANAGYLYVADLGSGRFPLFLRNFSNAAALVILIDNGCMKNVLPSHLGGYFRELGIPVIAIEKPNFNTALLKQLQEERTTNHKGLVYVDEFAQNGKREGFLAVD